jgi:hypothetical protein
VGKFVKPSGKPTISSDLVIQIPVTRYVSLNSPLWSCVSENERISTIPFLLWHFSPGDKTENCAAQFLAVYWIIRHRLKSTATLLPVLRPFFAHFILAVKNSPEVGIAIAKRNSFQFSHLTGHHDLFRVSLCSVPLAPQ